MRIDQIAVAYIEPSGKVTIIKKDEAPEPKGVAARRPADGEAQDSEAENGEAQNGEAEDGEALEVSAEQQLDELKAQLAKLEQTLRRRASRGDGRRGSPRLVVG